MASEYDPAFGRGGEPRAAGDLDAVQEIFERAAAPYLSSPLPWIVWGLALPGAALATRRVLDAAGARGVLLLWSLTILAAGAIEAAAYSRRRRQAPVSTLARWALRAQANLSLVGVLISAALLLAGQGRLLPALWLLLLGHSLYGLGGLASRPLRTCGLIYQLGGVAALVLAQQGALVFAAATAAGNLQVALALWRRGRTAPGAS